MQGKKQYLDKEVTHFRLSERVPPHNLYRRLAELVDWTFLYEETRMLYEELPWHSTVSRTRQLLPTSIFEQLFD